MQLTATVHGFVQGVRYRLSVKQKAENLSLTGFTKNNPDGTVHIVAQGEKENLDKLLIYLKSGPVFAKVDSVDYDFENENGNFSTFEVKRESSFIKDQMNAYRAFAKNILSNVKRQSRKRNY